MYITASSSISFQPSFRNKGFSAELSELTPDSQLITPDYSAFIPAMDRRRMSEVLKMSIACSMDCLEQAGLHQPDAIIVGTSMGCPVHTKNFLDKIIAANEGPLAPTNFIVSTHNTIAGQISLLLENHGYNMTHTQNSLSFEQALIDAILCLDYECSHVLVGAADEEEDAIYNMKARLNNEKVQLTCGASFFILSAAEKTTGSINLVDVGSFGLIDDPARITREFLDSNHIPPEEIDLVLYAANDQTITEELKLVFGDSKLSDYQKITGTFYTNAALAMDYGIDILSHGMHPVFGKEIRKLMIWNNVIKENLGLILVENKSE